MDNQFQKLSEDQQQQLLFMMLVQQHEQIGLMGLGKIKNPATDVIERDLNAAKYAIDTLAMLEKYTKGNIEKELSSYLQQKLSMLRLNYVDEIKSEPVKKSESIASSDDSDTE
jgi:beta-glucosidase/6-phospho-beta-glucosidase/beta-galactosidase